MFYGDGMLEALGKPFIDLEQPERTIQNAIAFLNLLNALEIERTMVPPRALVESIKHWGLPEDRLDVIPPRFFYALIIACMSSEYVAPKKHHTMNRFIERKLLSLVRWYFETGQHLLPDANSNLSRLPWIFLESDYRKWRERERFREEAESPARPDWPPFIESFFHGDFRFLALASHRALELEGRMMHHCLRTYTRKCSREMVRAFSIRNRETDERIATCTVKEAVPGSWIIDDLRGLRNAPVSDSVQQAVVALTRAFETAYALDMGLRDSISAQRTKKPLQSVGCRHRAEIPVLGGTEVP